LKGEFCPSGNLYHDPIQAQVVIAAIDLQIELQEVNQVRIDPNLTQPSDWSTLRAP
jgi:hypothetical protein